VKLSDYLYEDSWKEILNNEFHKPYFIKMEKELFKACKSETVYPLVSDIFNALNLTPFNKVKVVILGQDPYHGAGQAHGLSFSVKDGVRLPPSLKNIFKEIESDLEIKASSNGNLESWAKEGVLLLNNQLTVLSGKPMSHKNIGWNEFTDKIIMELNNKRENLVFILWGGPAQKKAKEVDSSKHLVISSVHPSPLSSYRGFFGSKPFTKANIFLESRKLKPINWKLN
jgi:uracil-DNA glycosylase